MGKQGGLKEGGNVEQPLRAALYDAVSSGRIGVQEALSMGIDPNAAARCERSGLRPAPLWRAALSAKCPRSALEALAAAGCVFGMDGRGATALGAACARAGIEQMEWYVDEALGGGLPAPATASERARLAGDFGLLCERVGSGPGLEDAFTEVQGMLHAFAIWVGAMLDKADGKSGGGEAPGQDEALSRCAGLARRLALLGARPGAETVVRAVRAGLPGGALAAFEAVGIDPEAARGARALMEEMVADMPGCGGFDLVRDAGWASARGARSEWRRALEAGAALARAGMAIDLEAAARSGSPFIVGAALGSGSAPSTRGGELAALVAAMGDQHEPQFNKAERALLSLMGPSKIPALGSLAVGALAELGCVLSKGFRTQGPWRAVASAERSARSHLRAEEAAIASAPAGAGPGMLGMEPTDPDLPQTMEEFARSVLRLAERERLGLAAPMPTPVAGSSGARRI